MSTSRTSQAHGETWIRRSTSMASAAAVAAMFLAGAVAPAASASVQAAPSASTTAALAVPAAGVGPLARYVVRAHPGHLPELVAALQAAAVPVEGTLDIVDSAVARLSAGQAAALSGSPSVVQVTADAPVQLAGSSYDPSSDANSMSNIDDLVNADQAWAAGATGQGVDVALVDSGVSPVQGLASDGQVVNGPDLSFESQSDSTRYLDTFGHGTFMAGLIAGHDPGVVADPTAESAYQGVAPGARIVSVKVADSHGRTDVTQVLAGIDWVVQHAQDNGLNIRVLNLSFGTDSVQPYVLDPLAYAAEVAWRHGIVVVVSSGNKPGNQLADPAIDPFVIAVGALDTNGTLRRYDDSVATFTATGSYRRSIDVVSPGVHVQGLRVPGSYIDLRYGSTGRLGDRFFRGSGTSQAAAITSGVVALMLSARPNLTPDQVKGLLSSTGWTVPRGPSYGAQIPNALRASFGGRVGPATQQFFRPSTGTGLLELSRGSMHVTQGGSVLAGEQDIFGNSVDAAALAAVEAAGASWDGGVWNGASWAGASWAGASWDSTVWAGASWDGASWDGASWDGLGWSGEAWS